MEYMQHLNLITFFSTILIINKKYLKVYRVEGNWPVRMGLDSLAYFRDTKRPEIFGDLGSLFSSNGDKWANIRSIANPILMQPKTIKQYMAQIDDIAKEFVDL